MLTKLICTCTFTFQPYQPSPPTVPASTASTVNSTENNKTSANENSSDSNSFSNFSKPNTYQSRQPWQARNQQRPSFSQQQEKEDNNRDQENRLSSQVPQRPVFVPRQQRNSYADAVKQTNENSNNSGKQFWKQSNQQIWTPG